MVMENYNDSQKRVINGCIENAVNEVEKDNNLSFYEKIDAAFSKVELIVQVLVGNMSEEDKNHIKEQIKQMIIQSSIIIPVFEDVGFKPWLDNVKDQINWKHRDDYYNYLQTFKGWSVTTVFKSIDKTTDIILDHMANPKGINYFTKKGLVIGDVQSGKTANYTALINKAIDVGYKLIIVLAGQQNDLRTQTQERLDKEVLGYETGYSKKIITGEKIGVGKLKGHIADVDSLTNRGNSGDFKKTGTTILISNESKPVIAVVKKNTTVLKNLYEYLSKPVNLINGKLDVPVLIIDDEVDQASINTKKNPEIDPTKINGRIRDLINLCNKVSYVGYTATPYANVLIDANVNNESYGEDLFPKDFIVVLPTPDSYCGVNAFFGSLEEPNVDLVEYVDDVEELVDFEVDDNILKLKSQDEISYLSESIKNAVKDFIVASAVRRSRGEKTHNGMMIHIAAYKRPATSLKELLEDYTSELKNEFLLDNESSIEKYRFIWEMRFRQKSRDRGHKDNWDLIRGELRTVFELLKVKLLNGDSKDIVDYSETTQSQIIAVGGNKLSRGITIEGLMISYYLRDPRAYDTAMQMGRWFGHKKSYIDLCRIYSQEDLISNFIHILDATQSLRADIEIMNNKRLTPSEFGLKIITHPTMLPTARNKMHAGTQLNVSFSEQRQETTKFNLKKKEYNKEIIDQFVTRIHKKYGFTLHDDGTPIARNVSANHIMDLLSEFADYKDSVSSNVERWRKYILKLNDDKELMDWTVVISNPFVKGRKTMSFGENKEFPDIRKAKRKNFANEVHDNVRAISNPGDFKYFFEDVNLQIKYKEGYKKDDDELKLLFDKKKALLVIYPIDITDRNNTNLILEKDIIGLAIWFPASNNPKGKVNYIVNSVYLNQDEIDEVYDDEK